MFRFILMGFLYMCLSASPLFAEDGAEGITEEKLQLAKKIIEISPPSEQLMMAITQVEERVPVTKRAQFRQIMRDTIDTEQIESTAQLSMVRIFTLDELKAHYAYSKSKDGRSYAKKLPEYQESLKPVIETMLREVMVKMQTNKIPFR